MSLFEEPTAVTPGVHPTAVVDAAASLGRNVSVGPHAVVGPRAVIGDNTVLHAGVFVGEATRIGSNCVLWPNVVVRERCVIGNRATIHPNTTIGADGFGYELVDGRHVKVPQIGDVVIEDDVEIGANSCVDRAKFGSTRIGQGTKIDNLVQIAHNVEIGQCSILAGQVALGGSVKVGPYCVLAGRAGVTDHAVLGSHVVIASCSCVSGVVPDNAQMAGIYAFDVQDCGAARLPCGGYRSCSSRSENSLDGWRSLSQQRTIQKEVEFCGRGLFGGEEARVCLKPADPDTGIVFVCASGEVQVALPARVDYLASRPRRTSLRNGTAGVETIEHCLAACAGLGIDNLQIEVLGR